MPTLILLRHGESDWNQKNLFTGWVDVDLTATRARPRRAAAASCCATPACCRTWCTRRCCAARSAPRTSRSTSPTGTGCRCAGRGGSTSGTTARCRARTRPRCAPSSATSSSCSGAARTTRRRRRWPTTTSTARCGDPRYGDLLESVPRTECLKDVVGRMLPYWYDAIVPDLRLGRIGARRRARQLAARAGQASGRALGRGHRRAQRARPASRCATSWTTTTLMPDRAGRVPRPGGGRRRDRGRRQPGQEVADRRRPGCAAAREIIARRIDVVIVVGDRAGRASQSCSARPR